MTASTGSDSRPNASTMTDESPTSSGQPAFTPLDSKTLTGRLSVGPRGDRPSSPVASAQSQRGSMPSGSWAQSSPPDGGGANIQSPVMPTPSGLPGPAMPA